MHYRKLFRLYLGKQSTVYCVITNPNLGGLFRDSFEVWGGKITPFLKLVRITLETSYLVRKYKHICSFRKCTFYYQGLLNLADVRTFLQNNNIFFGNNSTFTQSKIVIVSCLRDFYFCFHFL